EKVVKLLAEADTVDRDRDVGEDRDGHQHQYDRQIGHVETCRKLKVELVDPAERHGVQGAGQENGQNDVGPFAERPAALPDELERLGDTAHQRHAGEEYHEWGEREGERGGEAGDKHDQEDRQDLAGDDEGGGGNVEPPDEQAPGRGQRQEAETAIHEDGGGHRRVPFLTPEVVHARSIPTDHGGQEIVKEGAQQILLGELPEWHPEAHRPQHQPPLEDVEGLSRDQYSEGNEVKPDRRMREGHPEQVPIEIAEQERQQRSGEENLETEGQSPKAHRRIRSRSQDGAASLRHPLSVIDCITSSSSSSRARRG